MGVENIHEQEHVKLKFESDKGNPSFFYNKNILTYALKSVHENSKILRKRENFPFSFSFCLVTFFSSHNVNFNQPT